MPALSRFLSELRRRRVFRVAAVYTVAAWLIIQVAVAVFPPLHLPQWMVTAVIALTALGFPLALILAWAYDVTPEGVKRTVPEEVGHAAPDGRPPAQASGVDAGGAEAPAGRTPPGGRAAIRGPARTRLIVLPFRVLRPDPETDFLAFSLPDAVTSSLSGLQSLVVRSSLAAQRFASEAVDLRELAEQADVDVVLTGTLLQMGETLRVRTQLTDANDGTLIWSQTSDASLGNLFELQDQITHRIVESLELPLTARERRILRHDVPANARAYEFYLRANEMAYAVGGWRTARDLYLQSLEEDPQYAPAWAQLARCYRLLGKWSEGDQAYSANMRSAEAAFRRALAISPDLPVAHNLYAQLEVELGRAQTAMVRLLTEAHASGGDPQLFAGLVHACRFCGLLEPSLAAHKRARQLDPAATTSVAHTHYMLEDYGAVLGETFGDIGYIAPLALASAGRTDQAVHMLRDGERTARDGSVSHYLASLRAMLEGDREESVTSYRLATANLRDAEALHYQVRQLARLGEIELAVGEFTRVVEMGFVCFPFFARDSWLHPLRDQPGFQEALGRAEDRHHEAARAFRAAGGEFLLQLRVPGDPVLSRSGG